MSSLILMACLAVSDVKVESNSVEEVVDVIELHQCYDFRGRIAFKQLIFYRWSGYHRRFQIVDTVVVTDDQMCPRKSPSGFYRCQWKDENGKRLVRGLTLRKSKSNVDPEIAEREFLPINLRQGLKQSIESPIVRTAENQRSMHEQQKKGQATIRTSLRPPLPEKILKF